MDIFQRFAPFIQDFIYLNNWYELRDVQIAAADVIFNTDNNLLLAASTASGKTEAAFFPILTLLHENPPASVGALYIGPLKALINDQFLRLEDLLLNAGIPVWRWHGDVSQTRKEKLLKQPSGILQITPESLEALLMRRYSAIPRLFKDLRFIVIDEVHALLRGDRGGQTLCCLERLNRIAHINPRRVGLSATIGDPEATANFLAQHTNRGTSIPRFQLPATKWRLAVEHFLRIEQDELEDTEFAALDGEFEPKKHTEPLDDGLTFIYEHTRNKKCLIFSNSREECEVTTATLRQLCEEKGEADRFLIHHGNLSTSYREIAERSMRDEEEKRSTVTTSTLELGIDIGRLERVFQLDAPFSVSSFLQRLGRTGRRGSPPEMSFVVREWRYKNNTPQPTHLPWKLIQAIAIIQLYREERWVEPPRLNHKPFSLLYHQTLSIIASEGELTPPQLAARVLTLSYFSHVTQDEYRLLLSYLLENEILQRTDRGGLILGPYGERQTSIYKFYAVFQETEQYTVRSEGQTLGTIANPPPVGEKIAIAGHVWLVDDIDYKRHLIECSMVPGKVTPYFGQCPGDTHTRILERMRQVLQEDCDYPYLMPRAQKRLHEARELARVLGVTKSPLVHIQDDVWGLFPWLGTGAFLALERFLKNHCAKHLALSGWEASRPYFLLFHMHASAADFFVTLTQKSREDFSPLTLLYTGENPRNEKYDEFLPPLLVRQAFITNVLDIAGMQARIDEWKTYCVAPPQEIQGIDQNRGTALGLPEAQTSLPSPTNDLSV